jgi:hypothetical protein
MPPTISPAQRTPPPVVGHEDVKAACGHVEKFALYPEKQDRFRADRRKKAASRPCQACREAARKQQEAGGPREAQGRQTAALSRDVAYPRHGRLPDGARFEVSYDAAWERWSGTLTVGGQTFTGEAPAVFRLLSSLDRQYRKALAARAAGAAQDAPAGGGA